MKTPNGQNEIVRPLLAKTLANDCAGSLARRQEGGRNLVGNGQSQSGNASDVRYSLMVLHQLMLHHLLIVFPCEIPGEYTRHIAANV